MTPTPDALAGLRDIHLPEAVGFWPLAPGWWIALLLVIGAITFFYLRRRAALRGPDATALRLLDELTARFAESGNPVDLAIGLSALLRRIGLVRFQRSEIASLHGRARRQAMEPASRAAAGLIERLENVVYAGDRIEIDADEPATWIDATRHYIGRPS